MNEKETALLLITLIKLKKVINYLQLMKLMKINSFFRKYSFRRLKIKSLKISIFIYLITSYINYLIKLLYI